MPYGIIADDLTGACDVAGRLTHLGYRPVVYVRPPTGKERKGGVGFQSAALVVNSRSRECGLDKALMRVQGAVKFLERAHAPVVYQKIDSTLRGHWAEELRAVAELTRPDYILVCPAFPAQGRRIQDGRLLLDPEVHINLLLSLECLGEERLRDHLKRRCHLGRPGDSSVGHPPWSKGGSSDTWDRHRTPLRRFRRLL